jgi:ribose/xylose/arabinose/galactoside ABC-type transport system permease subunit
MTKYPKAPSSFLTSIISSRYLSVWIAIGLLIVIALLIAPETLTRTSFTTVLPLTSFLATALGASLLIGLTSGFLVGVLKLNPLIVTLAVGQNVHGATLAYAETVLNEASVPPSFFGE